MEAEINYSQVPYDYQMCLKRDCPQAQNCLRQLAAQVVPADVRFWIVVNPKHLDSLEGACPFHRPATRVRFAKGFIGMLENLPHKQMRLVIFRLINAFSRRTYYRIRKGERLLSPSEQKEVLDVLKRCGVSHPGEFDAYADDYEW